MEAQSKARRAEATAKHKTEERLGKKVAERQHRSTKDDSHAWLRRKRGATFADFTRSVGDTEK